MKKYLVTFCCLVIMAMAAGCADKASSGRNGYQSAGVSDVLEDRMAEEDVENGSVKNEEMIAGNDEVILQSGDNMDAPDTDGESLVSDAGSEASEGGVEEGAEESGSGPETDASGQAGGTEGTGGEAAASGPAAEDAGTGGGAVGIDVDLTTLSSTMVYSEVYNMMSVPENYIGKTVKMDGMFAQYHDEVTDKYYFACIIADATACCSQGIEFELTDEYKYPDDYPKEGESICLTGVFDTYQEGDNTYCTLRNAKII